MDIVNEISRLTDKKDIYSVGAQILMTYNVRISELRSITEKNYFNNQILFIRGNKHSDDIIIRDIALLLKIAHLFRRFGEKPFEKIKYSQWYHYFLSNYSHIIKRVVKKKNRKVTHIFRYVNVASMEDERIIKAVLHHNSKKSNHYYKNKIRGVQNGNN